MAVHGFDLAFATQGTLFTLAGATGMVGTSVDLGPFLPIEQAMVAESVAGDRQPAAFGHYSLTGGLASAGGALAAVFASTPQRIQIFSVVCAAFGLATAALPLFVSAGAATAAPCPLPSMASRTPLVA